MTNFQWLKWLDAYTQLRDAKTNLKAANCDVERNYYSSSVRIEIDESNQEAGSELGIPDAKI